MAVGQQNYQEIVKKANSIGDIIALIICLAAIGAILFVSFIIGLIVVLSAPTESFDDAALNFLTSIMSIVGIVFGGTIIMLITIRMLRQVYLGNALQIEYSDYAWLRQWADKIAKDLKMPKVEIMVTQDPVMNAFAFGFMKPYTIVLNSGSIRYLSEEQLKVVVLHEMAHVKYHHTLIGTYLSIFRVIPLFGGVFGWILDFWNRRTELTADRLALWYLKDAELVKMSLIRVHVGPDVAESFNEVARQWQVYMTRNSFNAFTQTFSNHPFLVRRLQHLDRINKQIHPSIKKPSKAEESNHAATS